MEQALADFWSQLHSADGLRRTIESGGLALMVLIIFAETGLLAGFFLPGDSLLVTAGVLSIANGGRPELFDPWVLCVTLTLAAVAGDQTGYWLGRKYGDTMETRADTWWYKRRHLDEARDYFARYGAAAIVLARFVPVMRTFVPFVAGMGRMERGRFVLWNALGGVLWVWSLVWLGHLIGGTPLADKLHKVILIVVAVSLLPLAWAVVKRLLRR
ncbi:MAG: inner membrane protein YqjA [Verrucomicrobiota bacterium]|jgi:membrane-associated protein